MSRKSASVALHVWAEAFILFYRPDSRVMEFVLVKLEFPPEGDSSSSPAFSKLSKFRTTGIVMNIFLLDPNARLLSAFIWVPEYNTIGLFVIPDWEQDEYIYVDTTIECVSNNIMLRRG